MAYARTTLSEQLEPRASSKQPGLGLCGLLHIEEHD
jgi:hypothetical protein